MRRTIPRPFVVVASIVTLLGVMAGVGIGQTVSGHGGMPADVYTQTLGSPNDEACAEVNADGMAAMPLEFDVAVPSLVVANASFDWEGLDPAEIGVAHLELDGPAGGPIGDTWFMATRKIAVAHGAFTWSWTNVQPGQHTVSVYAAVGTVPGRDPGSADLLAVMQNCSLAVFVSPMK